MWVWAGVCEKCDLKTARPACGRAVIRHQRAMAAWKKARAAAWQNGGTSEPW